MEFPKTPREFQAVFHRTRVPLLTWFWAIFCLARHKQDISALQLQRNTSLTYGS